MKKLSLIISFIAIVSIAFTQNFVKNGSVHFNDGRILTGDVFLYDSEPDNIRLENETEDKTIYYISEIDYIRGISILLRNINFKESDLLFEAIVEGDKASLYKRKVIQTDLFYVFKDDKIYLLEGGKIQFDKDKKRYSKENNRYKGVLKVLLKDDVDLVKAIDKIEFTEHDLSMVIRTYNEGIITYVKTDEITKKKVPPVWSLYGQYSNVTETYIFTNNNRTPAFFQLGTQMHFKEGSRHSFKFGFEYGKYTYSQGVYKYANLNFNYLFDFYKMSRFDFYLLFRVFDIAYVDGPTTKGVFIAPRLSPGIGAKFHLNDKFKVYAEINHMLKYKTIPRSFSVGISYNL